MTKSTVQLMVPAKVHVRAAIDADNYGFGTVFRLSPLCHRVQGKNQLGVIIAVDDGDEFGRTLVVTFEETPNSTYSLKPQDIIVIRK